MFSLHGPVLVCSKVLSKQVEVGSMSVSQVCDLVNEQQAISGEAHLIMSSVLSLSTLEQYEDGKRK